MTSIYVPGTSASPAQLKRPPTTGIDYRDPTRAKIFDGAVGLNGNPTDSGGVNETLEINYAVVPIDDNRTWTDEFPNYALMFVKPAAPVATRHFRTNVTVGNVDYVQMCTLEQVNLLMHERAIVDKNYDLAAAWNEWKFAGVLNPIKNPDKGARTGVRVLAVRERYFGRIINYWGTSPSGNGNKFLFLVLRYHRVEPHEMYVDSDKGETQVFPGVPKHSPYVPQFFAVCSRHRAPQESELLHEIERYNPKTKKNYQEEHMAKFYRVGVVRNNETKATIANWSPRVAATNMAANVVSEYVDTIVEVKAHIV